MSSASSRPSTSEIVSLLKETAGSEHAAMGSGVDVTAALVKLELEQRGGRLAARENH